MKHMKTTKCIAAYMAAALLLTGCGSKNEETAEPEKTETAETAETQTSSDGILSVTTITEVFGDGQKPSAAALEYPGEIDSASLSPDDFQVEGQTITAVYTNAEAALTEEHVPGNYVILHFAYENTAEGGSMGGGAQQRGDDSSGNKKDASGRDGNSMPNETDAPGRDDNSMPNETDAPGRDGGDDDHKKDGGDATDEVTIDGGLLRSDDDESENSGSDAEGSGGRSSEKTSASLSVSVIQTGEVLGTDGTVYAANETTVKSSGRIDLVVQDFQLLEYTDPETGATIPYSLYLPENYDETREYPLLFFVADAGANGDDPTQNLTQGNGAVIWATPEEQAKHECIVLSPQYTNTLIDSIGALTTDENIWTDGLTLVSNLLHYVIGEYSVDENRIYGTGQSQGCMTNIAFSDKYPDLFAAQLLVAGQWNVEEMSAMKDKNLWIIVCEGDSKAYPGMNEATEKWESLGASVARSEMWDSTLPTEDLETLVEQTKAQGCKINYTVLEGGSHTYTWSVAYNIEGIRDWLFAQSLE